MKVLSSEGQLLLELFFKENHVIAVFMIKVIIRCGDMAYIRSEDRFVYDVLSLIFQNLCPTHCIVLYWIMRYSVTRALSV